MEFLGKLCLEGVITVKGYIRTIQRRE